MAKRITKVWKRILCGTVPYYTCKIFHPTSRNLIYYKYIKEHGDAHHLFLYQHEYDSYEPDVLLDPSCGLPYVLMPDTNRKLFFKRGLRENFIRGMLKDLLIEQDYRSPHRYFDHIDEFAGKTLLDIGAAEGILSLMAIDQVEHVYLFEYDSAWIEALQKTFEEWKDKVTIIGKYVGNVDTDKMVTLDSYFSELPHKHLFLKMDVEGMERDVLSGTRNLFHEPNNISFAICTYHKKDDFHTISSFLDTFQCTYQNQEGYFRHQLRSVVLRGHN